MTYYAARMLAAICITLGTFLPLNPACADQPRMQKAIELLEQAKTDAKPIPLLEKAKEHVENATPNKGGARPAAVNAIDEAIEAAKNGGKATKKINRAIELVQTGIERAKDNR